MPPLPPRRRPTSSADQHRRIVRPIVPGEPSGIGAGQRSHEPGRQPSAPRAPRRLEIAWHERIVTSHLAGQFVLTVPLRGGPLEESADAHLTRLLDRRLVTAPQGEERAITSVVASFNHGSLTLLGGRPTLTVLLTAQGLRSDRIDGPGLGRHLQVALDQLGLDA